MNRPAKMASDVLAAESPERRAALAEIKRDATSSAFAAAGSKLERAAEHLERDLEAQPHLDAEASAAERESRGYQRGFAEAMRLAARWTAEAAERARRGGA